MICMRVETIDKPKTRFIPTSASVALFPAGTKSCALLNQFKPQQNQGEEKKQILTRSPKLDLLERELCRVMSVPWQGQGYFTDLGESSPIYSRMLAFAKSANPASGEIKALSSTLEYNIRPSDGDGFLYAGLFFSALINASKDKDFTILTKNSPDEILNLCALNSKNVTINGDSGGYLGFAMLFGSIFLNGNAGSCVGRHMANGLITVAGNVGDTAGDNMYGGTLMIRGNADDNLGHHMKAGSIMLSGDCGPNAGFALRGGTIIINGNAGSKLGDEMTGGSIIVNGRIKSLSRNIIGGDIYQYGVQLVKDGKILHHPSRK